MRIIRWISPRAHALYLVHVTILVDVAQPWLFLHRIGLGTAVAIALLLPFVTAALLGRLVEQPLMRARPPQWPAPAPQAARNNRSTASP